MDASLRWRDAGLCQEPTQSSPFWRYVRLPETR